MAGAPTALSRTCAIGARPCPSACVRGSSRARPPTPPVARAFARPSTAVFRVRAAARAFQALPRVARRTRPPPRRRPSPRAPAFAGLALRTQRSCPTLEAPRTQVSPARYGLPGVLRFSSPSSSKCVGSPLSPARRARGPCRPCLRVLDYRFWGAPRPVATPDIPGRTRSPPARSATPRVLGAVPSFGHGRASTHGLVRRPSKKMAPGALSLSVSLSILIEWQSPVPPTLDPDNP